MNRIVRAALAVTSGVVVFVLVSAFAFVVGIDATSDAACDGPCFDKWDEVIAVALVLGLATAAVTAWFSWSRLGRR
jgi:hypothetical protein